MFGVGALVTSDIWSLCGTRLVDIHALPKHLLWSLAFLKVHASEDVLCSLLGCDRKTLRKWVWPVIDAIKSQQAKVACGRVSFKRVALFVHSFSTSNCSCFSRLSGPTDSRLVLSDQAIIKQRRSRLMELTAPSMKLTAGLSAESGTHTNSTVPVSDMKWVFAFKLERLSGLMGHSNAEAGPTSTSTG